MIKKGLILFFLLCTLNRLPAQSYYFKNYGVNDGLSSNTITTILQDKKGFLWFGSRNGLNRFDGHTFKTFRNKPSDNSSIGSNSILSLFEDEKQIIWVGTTKGIYLYDPEKENFKAFTQIPTGEVRYLKYDGKNNLWIISDFHLYQYHIPSHTVIKIPFSEEIVAINTSATGQVWIATGTGIIKRFLSQKNKFEDFNLNLSVKNERLFRIQELYPVNDSLLLIGTLNHAFLFNTITKQLQNIFEKSPKFKEVQVHTIIHQWHSEYWLGTETGLYVYNVSTGKTQRVQKQYTNPYSITDNVIFAFCKDREGGTWIGTFFGGVNYYSRQYNTFQKFFPQPDKNSLSGNLIHEITSDQWGNLWVGTEDAGLNKINLASGKVQQFKPGNKKTDISYSNIHGLLATGNELWIGTYEHGLDVMNIATGKVIRHYKAGTDTNSLKSNFIVTIYETRKHEIYIGTWLGLFLYNREKDNFLQIPFFNTQVQGIYEDSQGMLWVNTYGNGVFYYNPQTKRGINIRHVAQNSNSLINNYVNGLFEDSKHNFWFSTEGGLTKYTSNGKFVNYTMETGLPDNQVFRVLEDVQRSLWISTSKGLVHFNPANQSMTIYKSSNGLLTEQFNYNSSHKYKDGTLYFGTVKGLVGFNPSSFLKNNFIPPVYITGIQVNNNDLSINPASLQESITYVRRISLPYDSANLSFDVAALSYNTPEMNEYLYKMEGFDKEWTLIRTNRKIYYPKLPPGTYVFKVKGSAGAGAWNKKETILHLEIRPPFWKTVWAYLFYLLLGAGIIFTILRYYYIALKVKNIRRIEAFEREKEREIYSAKIDFFTNIAHEIRTPLTLIKMPLDKLIKEENYTPQTLESLHIMKKNTVRLIDLTNQLLDFRKAEANKFSLAFIKSDINVLLTDVFSTFKLAAEAKSLSYTLELPRISLTAFIDEEAFKKILANLINNAIKYASKKVIIKLLPFSSEDSKFNIEFWNDGYLIPSEMKEKIFEPFYRMKATEKEAGTGIGLSLSRALAELHNGTLELTTSSLEMNLFLLCIPIYQEPEVTFDIDKEKNQTPELLSPSQSSDSNKPCILLVEDNKEILTFVKKELLENYHVLSATNGQEALQILQKENVQLVVSDIMMPVMDGIELCRCIKTDLQYSHIPIILLTAKNSLHSRIEGLEVGADAYLEKPFSMEHLQAQIINLISNRNIIKEYFTHSPLAHFKGIAHSKPDKNFIEELNTIINENLTNMDLDVDHLSRMMNMSRPTLYRKIKALSDLTPKELINLSRLKKAAELLAEGNHKINEVANMLGYSVHANFSRDFHKQFGVTPSAYINSLQPPIKKN